MRLFIEIGENFRNHGNQPIACSLRRRGCEAQTFEILPGGSFEQLGAQAVQWMEQVNDEQYQAAERAR